jgi:WD40 repeat protein
MESEQLVIEGIAAAPAPNKVHCIHFNQCHTCFLIGTDTGFAMYSVNPLEEKYRRDLGGGIGIAVQLFESNFVGLVGGGDNPAFPVNKFMLWNDYTGEVVAEKREKDTIVGLRINHEVVAVLTRRRAVIYDLEKMKELRSIKTSSNQKGVCALSSSKGSVFLCPGMEPGSVNIVDYMAGTERIVKCHDGALRSITLNTTYDDERAHSSGDTVFATTSEKGTLVRVFDVATQTQLKELRRGHDECEIYSVEFSRDSKCLAVTSSKGNVHIFSLSKDFDNVSSRASFLKGVSSYLGSRWSPFSINFATATTPTDQKPGGKDFQAPPSGPQRHVACVTSLSKGNANTNDAYQLLILGVDGSYAVHNLLFKDATSTPITSGLIRDIKKAQTYAQAAGASEKKS